MRGRGAATALLPLFLSLLLAGCALRGGAAPPAWSGAIHIGAPPVSHAGQTVSVLVEADAPDGAEVTLTAMWGYGPRIYRGQMLRGAAAIAIPATDTSRQAGRASLIVGLGASEASTQLTVEPGPVDTLNEPLVGPRSACVGTPGDTMAIVIASDQYGNPPSDDTAIDLSLAYPDGSSADQPMALRGGLAWGMIDSRTRRGILQVGAIAKGVVSSWATMSVAACVPDAFRLRADPPGLPADGRQVLTLSTTAIVDRYGNPMPDGTLVTFQVTAPGGEMRLPAQTIAGVAEVSLRAPDQPGEATARALILGVESAPLTIIFRPVGGP